MELPADHTASAAPDEGRTLCFLFGKAFNVVRSEFSDFFGYYYAAMWSKFVLREAYAAQVQCTDAGEVYASTEQLVQNGQCLLNVRLCVRDGSGKVRRGRVPFKPNESVWLSRTDPYEDCHRRALQIARVEDDVIYFKPHSNYPEDAEQGEWRLDLGINESQVSSQLHCIKQFAQTVESPLYRIIVKSQGPSEQATLVHPPVDVPDNVLRALPGCGGLNVKQMLAVQQSLAHHLVLIQGPPGTGKTTTSAALVSAHRCHVDKILLVDILFA